MLLPDGPDARFRCIALACFLRARVCVRRQLIALGRPRDMSRTPERDPEAPWSSSQRKRGQGPAFAHCLRCTQGRALRELLGDEVAGTVRHGLRNPNDLIAYAEWGRAHPVVDAPTIDSHLADES